MAGLPLGPMISGQKTLRQHGVAIGVFAAGPLNDIADVAGVGVGHTTRIEGDAVRTGATAIVPHGDNLFQRKVTAAVHVGNGFGKMVGALQVQELGLMETPIVLTNTLNVATASEALVDWTLIQPGNETVRSVNALVGETNDGYLNDIRGRHVTTADVRAALEQAVANSRADAPIATPQGNIGAGTGTVCFGWKGGIGTSSRRLPAAAGAYTVGVLVQSNFGGTLTIAGVPVGVRLGRHEFTGLLGADGDGSCMVVVATDAPLCARNLQRLASRAMLGLGRVGGVASNGSGEFVIAFSTAHTVPHTSDSHLTAPQSTLRNDAMTPLFAAAVEATEEAVVNSLFCAESLRGVRDHQVEALPVDTVLSWLGQR